MKISRTIYNELRQNILPKSEKKPALIILGPRQVGKTTLVKHLLTQISEKSAYFNCDYADVRDIFDYKKINTIKQRIKDTKILVLDEAQRIENIGLVLKVLVDEHNYLQVIATGSSSFDLSNKINEPLTGRKKEFHLFPFSFEEIFGQETFLEQQRQVQHFLRFGSYPDVYDQNDTEAEKKLRELTNSYLFKDVFTFQQLRKSEVLTKLLRLLAFQIGSEVSFHELAQQLGVDQVVIQRYIQLLESAFVIFRLGAFKRNLRNEITKSRKIYFWDLGIRNSLIRNFNRLELRDDVGALWENFCITERLKFNYNHNRYPNSYFWRTYTQKEIDYIEEEKGELHAFELKWNSKKKARLPQDFLKTYKPVNFITINPENFTEFIL